MGLDEIMSAFAAGTGLGLPARVPLPSLTDDRLRSVSDVPGKRMQLLRKIGQAEKVNGKVNLYDLLAKLDD